MKRKPADEDHVSERADEAIRRALNTPPKQHKEIKKERKKRQDDQPTAASGNGKRT